MVPTKRRPSGMRQLSVIAITRTGTSPPCPAYPAAVPLLLAPPATPPSDDGQALHPTQLARAHPPDHPKQAKHFSMVEQTRTRRPPDRNHQGNEQRAIPTMSQVVCRKMPRTIPADPDRKRTVNSVPKRTAQNRGPVCHHQQNKPARPGEASSMLNLWVQVDHTFALKRCPQQISGGQPPTHWGVADRSGSGFVRSLPKRSLFAYPTPHRGGSRRTAANAWHFQSVVPQVRPQTNGRERLNERLANVLETMRKEACLVGV